MQRFLTSFLLFVSVVLGQPTNRALFDQIDETLADLAKVTGLPVRSKVDRDFITRDKLKEFLKTRIDEAVKPEEIRVEELTLKLFGFVPENYNLKDSTVSLLTEQAAAFYDYRKKKMFLLEGAPEISQKFVLIHELAHALADQHFRLERYIRQGKNDDSATARMAVMEGQAQWLMYEVMAAKAGQSLRKDPAMVRMFVNASSVGLSDYPELSNSPLYIRESLLFPYTKGLFFQQQVVEKLGTDGFSAVFRNPPRNSRQILHPEIYFSREKGETVRAPKLRGGYADLVEGDLGEFDIQVMLHQFVDEETAGRLAPHWRGGRYRVGESKAGKQPALAFTVVFDTASAAEEFADLYRRKVLPAKTKRNGQPRVEQDGTRVRIIEGLN